MSILTSILCIILFIGIVLCLYNYNIKEGLENNNNVILLGDSVFKNNPYVTDKFSVENRLERKMNTLGLAEDGAVINDIMQQYHQVPEEWDNKNTYLFVSVGGNNILNDYYYTDVPTTNLKPFDAIWNDYESQIKDLKSATKCKIVLTDIYYITDVNYRKFHPLIKKWNNHLQTFAKKEKLSVYKISELVDRPQDFTHSIEPSIIGGQIIVDNIINF